MRIILPAPSIELGMEQPTDFVAKGTSQNAALSSALTAIASALIQLGKIPESLTVTAAVAQLPLTLSTKVRIG